MNFRILSIHDYLLFKDIINDFQITNFTLNQFIHFLENEKNSIIYVLEDNNELLAAGTILFEKKFIHNYCMYCHIEDIIVKKEHQKKGYGKLLIKELINVCIKENAYKILLDCTKELIPFYEKCGFSNNGYQMVIYNKKKY